MKFVQSIDMTDMESCDGQVTPMLHFVSMKSKVSPIIKSSYLLNQQIRLTWIFCWFAI